MKQKINISLAILFLALLFNSCKDKDTIIAPTDNGQLPLAATFYATQLYGIYEKGELLTEENYILLSLDVEEVGSYELTTTQNNGYKFTATGEFTSLGDTQIKLQAVGTPEIEQLDIVLLSSSESQEEVEVQVLSNISNKIIVASGGDFSNSTSYTMAITGRGELLWQIPGYSDHGAIVNDILYFNGKAALTAADLMSGQTIWANDSLKGLDAITYSNDVIYSSSFSSEFYATNAVNGETLWKYDPLSPYIAYGAPVVGDNLVFITVGSELQALDKTDGTLVWRNTTANSVGTPVFNNGILYTGGTFFTYALDATDGTIIWEQRVGVGDWSSPALSNGRLYVNGSGVNCLDAQTGDLLWNKLVSDLAKSPVIYEDKVLVTTDFGFTSVYAMNAIDSTHLWDQGSVGFAETELVAHQGILFLGSSFAINGYYINSGELVTLYGGFGTDPLSLDYLSILAVYDADTKEVAYPTNSGNNN